MPKSVSKQYITSHVFSKTGLEEDMSNTEYVSARFAPNAVLPSDDVKKLGELRIELSNLIIEKCGNLSSASIKTSINTETLRKYISLGESKRGISRVFLAKIVVGLGVSLEEADKLFSLQSYALDPNNVLLDAIVVNCLQNHEDIYEFYETCEQVGFALR